MGKISFFQSNKIVCPVCNYKFSREVMHTGSGRLVAGDLMDDLRRMYRKSSKYGKINPLIYNPVVCPSCLYAALPEDYAKVPPAALEQIQQSTASRKKHAQMLFGDFDYSQPRDLRAGAKAFFLCLCCYVYFTKSFAPSTKKSICSMRASWCVSDLHQIEPNENYETLYQQLRHLSYKSYEKCFETTSTGAEDFRSVTHVGPDTDVNFGYEGVLYITCYLGYEHKDFLDDQSRYEKMKHYRTVLAKVFGFGKSSKSKPTPLLNKAKNLHELIHKEVTLLKKTVEEVNLKK